MKDGPLFKLRILLKSIEIFRNWYLYPLVYFNLTSKPFVIFETKTDLKLKIRTKSTDLMALTHVWLIEEYRNVDFKIGNNDTIVDVGAHIGLFSLFAAQFCKKGRVFCFEPVNDNYELLLENIKLNNITNIIPFNCAVSQNSSKVKIFLNDDQSSHSMFIPNSESIEVPSISVHDIFKENEIKKCDLLKLDCEGAEYDIIKSIKQEFFGFSEATPNQDNDYPYCVFGLKRSASDEDMKKAYRKSVLKAHPDKGGTPELFRNVR